ncbi:MAG: L-threonylcarbamoyladenylate synthase [Bryobacteraceae bacterium]
MVRKSSLSEAAESPARALIPLAAALIQEGKLVAFPTETVYGLGANALDAVAVNRVFEVKGRPFGSPLIVHVDSVEMAQGLARDWPPEAELLARRYWPGPLTLVVRKEPRIPGIVTAGLDTVGLRMPAHPLALELIRAAGTPLAGPSANRFGQLSPTTAEHVRAGLGGAVDLILDGGPCRVGIESTVLSLAGRVARLLRPGMVSRKAIEELIGRVEAGPETAPRESHPSPGMHPRHYSPRTPLLLVRSGDLPERGRGAYLYMAGSQAGPAGIRAVEMPADAGAYAALLYETLHTLDGEGLDWIAVEQPPDAPEWAGVKDRLERASS